MNILEYFKNTSLVSIWQTLKRFKKKKGGIQMGMHNCNIPNLDDYKDKIKEMILN